ncbi:MAG: hypothetical protein IAF94_09770 [Pirellulaceae bacterium]|nr:hypothetical protein [Pirellulaceae bacterium]
MWQVSQIARLLRAHWLVGLHFALTATLLLEARLVGPWLRLYLGDRSPVLQNLEASFAMFLVGWLACQVGLIALWCALAPSSTLRRVTSSLALLTLGWVILQTFQFARQSYLQRPPMEIPIMTAVNIGILFVPLFCLAWCFRFQNRWRLLGPNEPPHKSWQFSLADGFRLMTIACILFALAAATMQFFAPLHRESGAVPWYFFAFACLVLSLNLVIVPIMILGAWGLLADSESRFRFSLGLFGVLTAFVLLMTMLAFLIRNDRGAPGLVDGLGIFVVGLLVPGFLTAWLVRRAGYRVVRLPPVEAFGDMMHDS